MTFGLRNAAQTFQRFMGEVARLLLPARYHCGVINYRRIPWAPKDLFQYLQQLGMAIDITKCVFWASEVSFLEHLISREGVALSQKVKAIKKFPELQNIKGLRRFLDMINFYHRFLSNIANMQVLLLKVLKGQKKGNQASVD